MKATLKLKLVSIVGVATLSFLWVIVFSMATSTRIHGLLTRIERQEIPKIQLGPKLRSQFEGIARRFQEAVAAKDPDGLLESQKLTDRLIEDLSNAGSVLDSAQVATTRGVIIAYHRQTQDVAKRLIEGETGEALVQAMADMQRMQQEATKSLQRVSATDPVALAESFSSVAWEQKRATYLRLWVSLGCLLLMMGLSWWLGRSVLRALASLTTGFERFGQGDFSKPILVSTQDELGHVALRANQMAEQLQTIAAERARVAWLDAGQAGLVKALLGELTPPELADRASKHLASYIQSPAAAFFYMDDANTLRLLGQYSLDAAVNGPERYSLGQGLVAQAALQEDVLIITDLPAGYLRVRSGLGEADPKAIVMLPLVHHRKVKGVLELALFHPWEDKHRDLWNTVRETLVIALEVTVAQEKTRNLLTESQELSARLTMQEEELRSTNEELQTQQEELRQSNEELRIQTDELNNQRRLLQAKNDELGQLSKTLELKAQELTTVSAYKSQFLTNMSHELRTPLNSMLLLSNLLSENQTSNLSDKQVEYCKTIYSAGKDLLALINQVLDLAKVEAGKQELRVEDVQTSDLVDRAHRVFEPLAKDKALALAIDVAPDFPRVLRTDKQRVEQILTNLVANAIKFTGTGTVALRMACPLPNTHFVRSDLKAQMAVAFSVTDTGPGIAPEHQHRVFAPFEQVENKSDRRFGGTGLGLTIARELAALLGGEIQLDSQLGKGSTFTCYLPRESKVAFEPLLPVAGAVTLEPVAPSTSGGAIFDDRDSLRPGDPYLLIIEDDRVFGETFGEVIHNQGLKYVHAPDAQTGLRWARERPPRGIILDVHLPDMDGFAVLQRLRDDPKTAAVPVHFASALDAAERGLALGAVGYLNKPATRKDLIEAVRALAPKAPGNQLRILVVEDDATIGDSLMRQLTGEQFDARRVSSAKTALEAISHETFSCLIVDLSLPDMDGLVLLEKLREKCGASMPSVVIYTARALTTSELMRLEAYTQAIVLKEGPSTERLLNEVRLFARRLKEGVPVRKDPALGTPINVQLGGRKLLIADDDMRTVYALSALLRAKGAEVLVAENGRVAVDLLNENPDVEALLIDIMMPEMDGYEAMRRIRQDGRFGSLPIVALTAKAMKGDEAKCIEAGATDYIPKPIESGRLLTVLQSRLSRQQTPEA